MLSSKYIYVEIYYSFIHLSPNKMMKKSAICKHHPPFARFEAVVFRTFSNTNADVV